MAIRATANELSTRGLPPIPDVAKTAFWAYFALNRDKVVLSIHGIFKVKLGQLEPVFALIFGPNPGS